MNYSNAGMFCICGYMIALLKHGLISSPSGPTPGLCKVLIDFVDFLCRSQFTEQTHLSPLYLLHVSLPRAGYVPLHPQTPPSISAFRGQRPPPYFSSASLYPQWKVSSLKPSSDHDLSCLRRTTRLKYEKKTKKNHRPPRTHPAPFSQITL